MKSLVPLLAAAAIIPAVPAMAQVQQVMTMQGDAPLLTLNVTQDVQSTPDSASIGAGVQTTAPTATEALRQNSAKMDSLIKTLKAKGIAAKDIQTSGINMNAQYDYSRDGQPPRFTGYQVSNMVTVTTHDIPKLGELLDALIAAGGNSINGPNFSIDDPAPQLQQARAQALRTAAQQADFYAKATGFSRARLVSISEAQGYSRPMPYALKTMDVAAPPAPPPVEPGQVSNGVTLTVQYAMEK